jgi:rhamnulokinase
MLQAKAVGMVNGIQEMRHLIASSIETTEFLPQDTEVWNEAFNKFVEVTK